MAWSSNEIAARVAAEIASERIVSIGIGMPARVAEHVDLKGPVMLHMENGVLGLGPRLPAHKFGADVTNASGVPASVRSDAAFFDIDVAVTMMRGGHIDVAVLGAMEVDQEGNLAGWRVPGAVDSGMGGAMDLTVGARRTYVCMSHTNRDNGAKLVESCRLPLTARQVVDKVFSGLGVFEVRDGAFHLLELAPEVGWDEVAAATAGALIDARPSTSESEPAPTVLDDDTDELLAAAEPADADRDEKLDSAESESDAG